MKEFLLEYGLFLAETVTIVVAIGIILALVIAGFGLVKLFEHHVEQRFAAELTNHIRHLAGNLVFKADGSIALASQLSDPRFNQPFSGLYWQVSVEVNRELVPRQPAGSRNAAGSPLPARVDSGRSAVSVSYHSVQAVDATHRPVVARTALPCLSAGHKVGEPRRRGRAH